MLSQYRLVAGFKAKTVRPNYQEYADPLAFEYLWLICDGPVLTQYQQLSAGIIDWRVPLSLLVKPPTKRSALFPLWKRGPNFSSALLDIVKPSNSVEECALKLASFKQGATGSVSDYTLYFCTVTNRYESAVERQTKGRTPWAAFSVTLFQHGSIPSIQCLQLSDKPVTSLRQAVTT